jgi:hypothetical protein
MLRSRPFSIAFDVLTAHLTTALNLDFTILFNDNRFPCSALVASSFSRVLHVLLLSDPFACELAVSPGSGPFELVQAFLLGRPVSVDESNAEFLLRYAIELEMDLLITELFEAYTFDFRTIATHVVQAFESGCNVAPFIPILAAHFAELESTISSFPISLVDQILAAPECKSPIIDVLHSFFDVTETPNHRLAKYYRFTRRDLACPGLNLNALRNQISERWIATSFSNMVDCIQKVPFVEGRPFEGILYSWLAPTITGSRHAELDALALSLAATGGFLTVPDRRAHLLFDFGINVFVVVTHYSLLSGPLELRTWVLEASEDGDLWMVIDGRSDVSALSRTILVFPVDLPTVRARCLRLTQICDSPRPLCLCRIEFFGLIEMINDPV